VPLLTQLYSFEPDPENDVIRLLSEENETNREHRLNLSQHIVGDLIFPKTEENINSNGEFQLKQITKYLMN
jgi:hypothetical protein